MTTTDTARLTGSLPDTTGRRPLPDPETADAHALTVLFSPDRKRIGLVLQLPPRRLEIGRQATPPCLLLEDTLVSRLHATVTWDPGRERYLLTNEGSRNGTMLNGQEIEQELLVAGDLIRVGESVLRFHHLDLEVVGWKPPADSLLKGRSLGLRRLLDQARRVAPTDLAVLIQGDTGTGKELVAREIHGQSKRGGRFIPVNCAAIPGELIESELFGHQRGSFSGAVRDQTGLLRAASGGTLFLDEIGDLPLPLQAKLLRVLEERQVRPVGSNKSHIVDLRFLSATNQDLQQRIAAGTFRGDLYARISQWSLLIPPLRERPEDLLPILEQTLREHGQGRSYELDGDFFEGLALWRWPFNVRELISLVRRVMVLLPEGGRMELAHLPEELRPGRVRNHHGAAANGNGNGGRAEPMLPQSNQVPSARELVALLKHYQGNVSEIAQYTGRERAQVYRWLRRYGLKPDEFRPRGQG
ncbi:MAG: sigma 54-interacting transcriptional regulator [Myxococcota bacterium]|nr:sigma 54-interacting transcriptional regulator [Myxococcota bacterium]